MEAGDGALPPMDDAARTAEFGKYRATPQAEILNKDMTLRPVQAIWWWNGAIASSAHHPGLVWAGVPVGSLAHRRIPPGWVLRLLGLGLLGGLRGAIGWWMVASGLTGSMVLVASLPTRDPSRDRLRHPRPDRTVRAAASSAARGQLLRARRQRSQRMARWGLASSRRASCRSCSARWSRASTPAGTFPNGRSWRASSLPPGLFELEPAWRNFLESGPGPGSPHRMVAYLLLTLALVAAAQPVERARLDPATGFASAFHMTLLRVALRDCHRALCRALADRDHPPVGAMALFVLILRARFLALYPRPRRIARG